MKPGTFAADDVQVWRVRRRLAARAARLGVGLMVLPVVATLALAVVTSLVGSLRTLESAVLVGWLAAWFGAAPLALLVSFFASLRIRREVAAIAVRDGALCLLGDRPETISIAEVEGAITVEAKECGGEAEIGLRSGDVLLVRSGRLGSPRDTKKASAAEKGSATEEGSAAEKGSAAEEGSAAEKGSAAEEGSVAAKHGVRRGPYPGSPEEARALVEALGFGGKERRTILPLGDAHTPLWRAFSAVGIGLVTTSVSTCASFTLSNGNHMSSIFSGMGVVFILTTLLAARLTAPRRLVIGADGVELGGPFRRRFFARNRIFGVERIQGGVSLLLRAGEDGSAVEQVQLPMERPERGDALLRQIRGAIDGDSGAIEPAADLLARGGEPIAAWRERLRRLVAPGEGYRARSIPVDVLLRTAADAEAPAELRVGAALAIAQSGDADAQKRLRIATEAVANEPVRIALETASESDAEDEAIAVACARAEPAARRG